MFWSVGEFGCEGEEVTITITPDTERFSKAIRDFGSGMMPLLPFPFVRASAAVAEFDAVQRRVLATLASGDVPAWPTWTFHGLQRPARTAMHAAYDHRRRARRRRNRR